jgi:exosortase/archaeosortase family protein
MTGQLSPMPPSGRELIVTQLNDAMSRVNDRVVLAVVFLALFLLNYTGSLIEAVLNISAVDNDLTHSRTASGAQVLGFVAVAVVLAELKSDRVLRWWDFLAVFCITIASLYPSPILRAVAMTSLGLLFIVRSDKRVASLGQLCIGLVWIDFWGALALNLIAPWLLPVETALAYLPLSLFGKFSLQGVAIAHGSEFTLIVAEPCSAFHNTIITSFIWLCFIKIQRLPFRREHFVVLAIGLVAIVFLNTARIGLMAFSDDQYLYWHLGPGLWAVKIVTLTTVLGLFYFGLRPLDNQPVNVI